MVTQLILNLGIAFVWTLLQAEYTPLNFLVGYVLGLVVLFIFRGQLKEKLYIYKWWAVLVLLVIFIKELIIANFIVIAQVLRPRLNIKPGIIAYPTELETGAQVTILANMISLTPGTLSMEVSPDNKIIYIHVFHIDDEESIVKGIKENFEYRIKEVAG
ncbi:Na+/H+ antiporter subunit E [Desulfitibacter alkalitolerans]|uniref:Na+/H+ antiporter subunit E n=1 Tax=Desulfitibacter alkalitolerans TaxID=264641 RepID=UPI0004834513|nr:Na+/H+ antiporter subunit E [Desulfitibacter alkalitolerans]